MLSSMKSCLQHANWVPKSEMNSAEANVRIEAYGSVVSLSSPFFVVIKLSSMLF